jgi:hypothetical protein
MIPKPPKGREPYNIQKTKWRDEPLSYKVFSIGAWLFLFAFYLVFYFAITGKL